MDTPNRLFLFAGYDKDCHIPDSLVFYVKQLSIFGDVALFMDTDCPKSELKKLEKYTIYADAKKHGEYDFGSYKRAYKYAKKILNKYDYVYLVNDSVYGPMFDIKKTLLNMESINKDAVGLIVAKHKTHSYMESWFVRLNKKVFDSDWFNDFITGVTTQPTKAQITIKYEHGLSNLIKNNGCSWGGLYTYSGRYTYNKPKSLFKHGCPFVKKSCFTRHNGSLGSQIKYILNKSEKNISNTILKSAKKTYGEKYIKWFLTYNPLKIFYRKTSYVITKLRNGGI